MFDGVIESWIIITLVFTLIVLLIFELSENIKNKMEVNG